MRKTSGYWRQSRCVREAEQNDLQQEINQYDPGHECRDQRSLDCIIGYQKLLRTGKFAERGKLPWNFNDLNVEPSTNSLKVNKQNHQPWVLAQYANTDKSSVWSLLEHSSIQSFVAIKSLLNCNQGPITKIQGPRLSLLQYVPFQRQEYDTMHKCTLNSQDALIQKKKTVSMDLFAVTQECIV